VETKIDKHSVLSANHVLHAGSHSQSR
jgi:hypothetical protein